MRERHPDRKVRWLPATQTTKSGGRKVCVSHTRHKDLSSSPRASEWGACVGAWRHIRRRDFSSSITGRRRSSLATYLPCPMPAIVIFKTFCIRQPCFSRVSCLLLDFFEIQRCFVDPRTKFYSSAVFLWKGGSFYYKILFF